METIDFHVLLTEWLIPILASVLMSLGALAVNKAIKWLHISIDDKTRGYLVEALDKGIDYASNLAAAAGTTVSTVEARKGVAADAVAYVVSHAPDALKRLGLTPESVAQMIEARIINPPPATTPSSNTGAAS